MTHILRVKVNGEWVEIPAVKGDTGEGVPSGGTTGQMLVKSSNTDYDTEWANPPVEVFWAIYGTTTYSDIMTAINAGKLVMCSKTSGSNSQTFVYRSHTSSSVTFYNAYNNGNIIISVNNSNVWDMSYGTFLPSQTGNSGKLLTTNGSTASWTGIKTINSNSLLGTGDINISPSLATTSTAGIVQPDGSTITVSNGVISVDINEIATDLNSKADVNLTNVNNAGTSTGAGWAMPSNTYQTFPLGASGTQVTAPKNGRIILNVQAYTSIHSMYVIMYNLSTSSMEKDVAFPHDNQEVVLSVDVKAGDVVSYGWDPNVGSVGITSWTNGVVFIPAQGEV